MEVCPACGGEAKGEYKQRYKYGTQDGEVEVYVEWKCTKCNEVW